MQRLLLLVAAGLLTASGCAVGDDDPVVSPSETTQRGAASAPADSGQDSPIVTGPAVPMEDAVAEPELNAKQGKPAAVAVPSTASPTTTPSAPREETPPATQSTPPPRQARAVTFEELYANQERYVGETVEVVGKVFFLADCPPAESGRGASECILFAYLAHPDRGELIYGQRDEAIPLAEGGQRLSCPERSATGGGCGAWEDAKRYRVIATVQHPVRGGRQTQDVELDVHGKEPA